MLTEICCCCEQYYYVESEGNPETDPLTLWLNGKSQRILSPQVDSSLTILDRVCVMIVLVQVDLGRARLPTG